MKTTKNTHVSIEFKVDRERDFKRYIKYLSNPFHIMWRNFLAGTFFGLGSVVGVAIVLGLVGFLLKDVLGKLPFFSELSGDATIWLENPQHNQE